VNVDRGQLVGRRLRECPVVMGLHEVGQPVEELNRREFDDAAGSRRRAISPAARTAPVDGLVSREQVADWCARPKLSPTSWAIAQTHVRA